LGLAQVVGGSWAEHQGGKHVAPALGGYCLVTLRDHQQWQPGEERWSVQYDGRRYQFATERERDIFATAPEAYAPMLGGDCPVTFAETGEREPGRLDCGVLHGSRLAFFASKDDRKYFLESPTGFTAVDLALGGQCVVTRRDQGKSVAGIPGTVAIFQGMRFVFASAHDRQLFLKNPGAYAALSSETDPHTQSSAVATLPPDETIVAPSINGKASGKSAKPSGSNDTDVILGALPAMAGYCPVTLRTSGTWIRGRYENRVELGEFAFLTAGPKERELLTKQPETYAPALGGDCAVTLMARGERARGSVYHAYEYDGRLFLFADAERKALFKASPAKYAMADVAAEGNCIVTKIDQQRTVKGLAEHATWYRGKLYRFAGAEQKQQFLAASEKYAEVEERL
jgi:YHS domain-containing protein